MNINRRQFLTSSSAFAAGGLSASMCWGTQQICASSVREGTTLRLANGRLLSYAIYGDSQGWPVIYFHGIPTSRIEARYFSAAAQFNGCRLIAIDRPGFGLSTFLPGRRVIDWVDDMRWFLESPGLPTELALDRFSVCCFSSGAAYALLIGARMPERVTSIGVVDGIAPLQLIHGHGGYAQTGFRLARNRPRLVRATFNANTRQMGRRPDRVLRRTSHFFSPCDRQMFFESRNAQILIDEYLECVRCGPDGVVHDMSILSCPWGYDLGDVRVPVHMWYGDRDITTPWRSMGDCLNRHVPHSSLTVLPGEGHLSMLNRAGDLMFPMLMADAR